MLFTELEILKSSLVEVCLFLKVFIQSKLTFVSVFQRSPAERPRTEDYFGYDLAGASEPPPNVHGECSSEHSDEEYPQDGFIYSCESTPHRGHRERREDPQERNGRSVAVEQRPAHPGAEANVPPLFGEAARTDAYEFFKGAPELSLPSRARGAQWLKSTTTNALAPGQVIPTQTMLQ